MISKKTLENAQELLDAGEAAKCRQVLENGLKNFDLDNISHLESSDDIKNIALALDILGKACFSLQAKEAGCLYFKKAISFLDNYLQDTSKHSVSELNTLSSFLIGLLQNYSFATLEAKNFGESQHACKQALALAHKIYNPASSEMASVYFSVSALYYRIGELNTAEAFTTKAKEIWDNPKSANLEKSATCMNNLGRIYEERGLLEHFKFYFS